MPKLEHLKRKIEDGLFEYSRHAVDQSIVRDISVREIREAFRVAEIIEDYPDDKYGPSCLVLGRAASGRPLHVQCSYPDRSLVKIITLYEPDPERWIGFKERKRT